MFEETEAGYGLSDLAGVFPGAYGKTASHMPFSCQASHASASFFVRACPDELLLRICGNRAHRCRQNCPRCRADKRSALRRQGAPPSARDPNIQTADLCDAHEDNAAGAQFRMAAAQALAGGAGRRRRFGCAALVIDGRATLAPWSATCWAVKNGWAGIIVYGCIRDSKAIGEMDLGVFRARHPPDEDCQEGQHRGSIFRSPSAASPSIPAHCTPTRRREERPCLRFPSGEASRAGAARNPAGPNSNGRADFRFHHAKIVASETEIRRTQICLPKKTTYFFTTNARSNRSLHYIKNFFYVLLIGGAAGMFYTSSPCSRQSS